MRQINARPGYKIARNVVRPLHRGAESVTWHGEKPHLTKYSARVIANVTRRWHIASDGLQCHSLKGTL